MITLSTLPYSLGDFDPIISKEAMEYHRNKHHKGYVTNLNKLIDGTEYEDLDLEEIIKKSGNRLHENPDKNNPIFNNAAQIWNHTFYFEGIAPQPDGGVGSVTSEMTEYFVEHFGSPRKFMAEFTDIGKKVFGSGWVWLIHKDGKAQIEQYFNAATPLAEDCIPLLTWDCWEHNYYIDHRNDRAAALEAFWKVINWGKMTEKLESIK